MYAVLKIISSLNAFPIICIPIGRFLLSFPTGIDIAGNPAMFTGRYYVGAFAEYADYQFNTKFDLLKRGSLKDGKALVLGLSGGYDFPAFSYNNNHFFQFLEYFVIQQCTPIDWNGYSKQQPNRESS